MIIRCKLRNGDVTEMDDGKSNTSFRTWVGVLESDESQAVCVESQSVSTEKDGRLYGLHTRRLVQKRDVVEIVMVNNRNGGRE